MKLKSVSKNVAKSLRKKRKFYRHKLFKKLCPYCKLSYVLVRGRDSIPPKCDTCTHNPKHVERRRKARVPKWNPYR